MGLLRIGATTSLWYEKDHRAFQDWWLELPLKIRIASAVVETLAEMSPQTSPSSMI